MPSWSFQPILDSFPLVVASALLLVLLLALAPRFGSLSKKRKGILIGLRLAVVGLVVVAMLRPTHVSTTKQPQSATLLILFDKSRSMQQPNESGDQSRWEAQLKTLRTAQPELLEVSKRLEVKIAAYDEQLHTMEFHGEGLQFPPLADGGQTDIGTSLSEGLRNELGKRLAAIVLLGDGVQTTFAPRVELQEAGRELSRLGSPLYTIAFGPAADVAQGRDVAVESLPDQFTAFVKNELVIQGTVRVRGYTNQVVPVELIVENAAGEKQKLGPIQVTAREDGQLVPVEMTFVPQQPGQYKLTLHAAEQSGELVTKNNSLSAFLSVLEGGLKVLYLEGDLRFEQRFLRRSIDASPDIDLEFQWFDSRQRDRWPVDITSLLKDGKYDAVIIGDLDSSALNDASWKQLALLVERGRGLVTLGGYHSYGPGGYFATPLVNVLPIKMDRFERQNFDEKPRGDLQINGPLLMKPTKEHPLTRLAAASDNERAWESLPPLTGANRFAAIQDGPGVQVVAKSTEGHPLLITGEYGQGRVLAFAADSTWRWWMQGRDAEHRRFWRQVILWLARREDLTQNDVWIKLSQRRFPPGGKPSFTLGAKSAAGDVIQDAKFDVQLIAPNGQRQPAKLTLDGEQWTGTLDAMKLPGDYRLEVTATSDGKPLGTAKAEFMVFDQDIELSNPAADHDQLARLANLTKEAGGKPIAPEQLPALLKEILARAAELEIEVQTRWQLSDTAADAWLGLLLLTALLTVEWTLRKKWGLV